VGHVALLTPVSSGCQETQELRQIILKVTPTSSLWESRDIVRIPLAAGGRQPPRQGLAVCPTLAMTSIMTRQIASKKSRQIAVKVTG
jgi:hypothetical protein